MHNAFLKKMQVKRCSLVPPPSLSTFSNNTTNVDSSRIDTEKEESPEAEQIEAEKEEDEKRMRRNYIRSLSLARDPSAEPLFLAARLKSIHS